MTPARGSAKDARGQHGLDGALAVARHVEGLAAELLGDHLDERSVTPQQAT